MINWDERRIIVKVAQLYYFEEWTQAQIAKKMGVSRPVVSKWLQKAKEQGIVEIYIKDQNAHTVELEQLLETKFQLKDVIVVPTVGYSSDMVKKLIGKAAAQYVYKKLAKITSIGISWGKTVSQFVDEFPYQSNPKLKIVPLIGGMGRSFVDIHSNQLSYELAKKLNCSYSYLYAPALAETLDLHDRLIQSNDISAVLESGKNVDIAVVGIGNPYKDSTMKAMDYLSEEDLRDLKKAGAIGDSNSLFFDVNGNRLQHTLNDKIIGLDLHHLREIPEVIALVKGTDKTESIIAALKARFINVLVLDELTAYSLAEENLHTDTISL